MILIDSNVLLDILEPDSESYESSERALSHYAGVSVMAINPIIYAEVSIRFSTPAEIDAIFPKDLFRREQLPFSAAFLAGKAHVAYRRRGGVRAATLPDFFIGAHAAVSGFQILTRDPRRFQRYFPSVKLITL